MEAFLRLSRRASYGDGEHFELPTLSSPIAVREIYDGILDEAGRSLLRRA